ncbi:MAG: hypothetical protein ACI4VF_09305 [Lachnospirales bacterium]
MKKFIIIFGVLFLILIFGALIILKILSPLLGSNGIIMPKYDEIESDFNKNYNCLLKVKDFMNSCDCDYIRFDLIDSNYMECYYKDNGGYEKEKKEITDYQVEKLINELKNNNYDSIIKKNNYIEFVKWSSLGSSCGIVYCENRLSNNSLFYDGKTDFNNLSKADWYYYKHIGD